MRTRVGTLRVAALRAAGLLLLVTSPSARAEDSALAKIVELDIAEQPLAEAVIELSRQSEVQIVADSDRVQARMAPSVRGTMSVGEALVKMLGDSGLVARGVGPNMVAIGALPLDELLDGGGSRAAPIEREPSSGAEPTLRNGAIIEEIIVTANRRAQNVQDVASGIRVLDGASLEGASASGFEDYVFRIPGIDLADSGMEKKIAIRGVGNIASNPAAAGSSASPIGLYLNDTPIQGNGVLPDMALYDLERIEVLKGPQGTLYGEGAQGGALKMLLARADPSELYAKAEATVGMTRGGGGLNSGQSFAVNAPVAGTWATRLVGSRRAQSGFVDFFNRGTRDENDARNLMGRLHVDGSLWDGLDLSAMILHQEQRLDQFATVQKSEGDLRNRNLEPQFADTDFTLAGVTLDYDLSFARMTSSTSWFRSDRQSLTRFPYIGALTFVLLSPVVGGGAEEGPSAEREWISTDNSQDAIAQEVRLVSHGESWFDWVAGVFYRFRENDFDYLADNDATDEPPPIGPGVFEFEGREVFDQIAGFGEVTLQLPLDVELNTGLRIFRESAKLIGQGWARGPLYAPFALGTGNPEATRGVERYGTSTVEVTPKASLSWFADDQRMVYALVANGVRSGGTNPNAVVSDITALFAPDSLWTYEVGAKTQWLDGMLTANVSLFHNDWRDLQVLTTEQANVGGVAVAIAAVKNVGRAFSRGAEMDLEALPLAGLSLGFRLSLLDGEITQGDPAGTVPDGSPLPQVSEVSYAASAHYELLDWALFGARPFARFDVQRVGDRLMSPPGTIAAPRLDGFQIFGTGIGVTHPRWDLSFGVHNLTDERPEIGGNLLELETVTIAAPRTWTTRLAFRY